MSAQVLIDELHNPTIGWEARRVREMEAWCEAQAAELVEQHGLSADGIGRKRLAKAVAAAVQRASLTLQRLAAGESEGMPADPPKVAPAAAAPPAPPARKAVSFDELLQGWQAETKPRTKTVYE